MKGQKIWNFLTVVAVALLVVGYFLGKADTNIMGKYFIVLGAFAFIASIVGSSRTYKKHSYKCPVCGSVIRPVGRWLPGLGFNGTNTVSCTSCGAMIHIQDLKQE